MVKKFFIAIITMLLLVGCSSVPDEVKQDMNNYRDSNISDNEIEFSYIDVTDLKKNSESALKKEYGQFNISDKVKFIQPDEINILEFTPISGFNKKANEAMPCFFEKSIIDSQNIIEDDEYLMFYNEEDKIYFCSDNSGFLAMLNPETFDISYQYNEPNIKIYHTNRNDHIEDEYQLKNGKSSIKQAVEYINEWLNLKYKPFSPEYDYKVNTVIVRKHDENYLFQFLAEATYKGVPLDSYTRKGKIINGMFDGKMDYKDYGIQIQMVNVNSVDSFTNLNCMLLPEVKETVDKVISLDSALKYCENKFTDFRDITISDIAIMYTLRPVYETNSNNECYIARYESHPVWEFVIDVSPEEFLEKGKTNTYGDVRKYIYIDMITGECDYDFEITL